MLHCQNYHGQPCSASCSCNFTVIPFQEQDTVLSNEIKPQSIISLSFFLIWASLNGHVNVVEKLLAAGAYPNHQNVSAILYIGF